MKLLERLVAIQTSKNLSDREFARLLGVSNTTWSDIKKGDVTIGNTQHFAMTCSTTLAPMTGPPLNRVARPRSRSDRIQPPRKSYGFLCPLHPRRHCSRAHSSTASRT
jgi:hypothetical protein